MGKRLTSFNAKQIEDVISKAIGKHANLSLEAKVTNISYVDDAQITLDKVIIKKIGNSFSSSNSGVIIFILGVIFGFVLCFLCFQETFTHPKTQILPQSMPILSSP